MGQSKRISLAAIVVLLFSLAAGAPRLLAQTPPPLNAPIVTGGRPVVVGPRTLGSEAIYRVVSSTESPAGNDSILRVLHIKWKIPQLLTMSLNDPGAQASVLQYVVPRGGDGSLILDRATPVDPGLQTLCVPLEAMSQLLDVLGAGAGLGRWQSTMTVRMEESRPPPSSPVPTSSPTPQAGCKSVIGSGALKVPVTATRTIEPDGTAILAANGSTIHREGGSGGAAIRLPRLRGSTGTALSSVSLTANFARDGTLTSMKIVNTMNVSNGSGFMTIHHTVSIDRAS
jgi:hypothetical protein